MVELNPAVNSQNGEDVLRSIEEFMVQQAHAAKRAIQTADGDTCGQGEGAHVSATVASREPSIESSISASAENSIDQSQQATNSPASNEFPITSVVRTVVGGLLLVVAVAVAWQTYQDNQTRKLIKALAHSSVVWLSSPFGTTQGDSESSTRSSAKSSDQAVQTPTPTSMQSNEVAELRQQLVALGNDLAAMRSEVERISSKQEQLSRDVERVQATTQNVSERVSSVSQPAPAPVTAPAHAPPRKKGPKLVRAETPKELYAAPVPPTASSTGTATVVEQPPRPPLPVPTAAETPSPLH